MEASAGVGMLLFSRSKEVHYYNIIAFNGFNLLTIFSIPGIPTNFHVKNIRKIGILCQKIGAL